MVEEAEIREAHGHLVRVARLRHLRVLHRAARLHDVLHAVPRRVVDGVAEGEEGVRGDGDAGEALHPLGLLRVALLHVREDRGDTVRDDAPRGGKGGKGRGRRDEHDDRVDDRRDSGRGEKRGRGDRGDRGPKSAEDLDAEMDRYHGGPENESPNKKAKKAPAKKGPVTQEDLDAEMDAYAAGGAPADAGDA